jgi:dihydroorotate dehydrogenase electron transfer subunit
MVPGVIISNLYPNTSQVLTVIKQLISAVVHNQEIIPSVHLLTVAVPQMTEMAKPGQFIMVQCGKELTLRRPLSIHHVTESGHISFLFSAVGKGTSWLTNRQKGDNLDLIGPLGNGFSINPATKHVLLIAGGIGIAPLAFLARELISQHNTVTLLAGAHTSIELFPHNFLHEKIKMEVATEDGSAGIKGMVTDLLANHIGESDQVFACGPLAMYQSIGNIVRKVESIHNIQVSLEVRMGCGIGTCYGCSIKTKQGMKQVCQDGPVFNLEDVIWQEIKL